jgi:hypothetical protein
LKYADQIPDFEEISKTLNLKKPETADSGEVGELLGLLKHVTEWNPPVKRGNREFNDQKFYDSLTGQFETKGGLSDKQVGALKKIIIRYADQIPDFDAAREKHELPEPRKKKAAE